MPEAKQKHIVIYHIYTVQSLLNVTYHSSQCTDIRYPTFDIKQWSQYPI